MSDERSHGMRGATVVIDTTAITGNFFTIEVLEAAILNTTGTVSSSVTNISALNGVSLPVGFMVRGIFSSVQLVSGKVVVYHS